METLFIGQHLLQLDVVASTNTYAMHMLKDVKMPEGTVIITENQTQGKGQRGNQWKAEPSMNLTFSVIVYPTFLSTSNHFYLSKITALAIHDVLTELLSAGQHDIQIKWPNDIMVDESKIAGILIENIFRHEQLQQSVIGIGLNVNQQNFEGLDRKATSMKSLANSDFDKKQVFALLCKKLEERYLQLRNKKFDQLDQDYLNRLYLLNVQHIFKIEDKEVKATITTVDETGKLHVVLENGEQKQFEVKEIVF